MSSIRDIPRMIRYRGQLYRDRIRQASRFIARNFRTALPIVLDVAAFVCIVIGAAVLFGDWAWLVAGFLLILAGLRAQS